MVSPTEEPTMATIRSSESKDTRFGQTSPRDEALAWITSAWASERVLAALHRHADEGTGSV
jgi:hypothetical protein